MRGPPVSQTLLAHIAMDQRTEVPRNLHMMSVRYRNRAVFLSAAAAMVLLAACSQNQPAATGAMNSAAPAEAVELPEVVIVASRTGSPVNSASPGAVETQLE